jgi:preprotein translocase subunit SecY
VSVILNIFRIPELRKKILITCGFLLVYRIGAHIPIPGINIQSLQAYFEALSQQTGRGLLDLVDLFAGGALKRFTIFALGIMPYISSSIIMQLLTVVIPYFERLSKEGADGRKKISQYTRYGTVLITAIQGFAMTSWMKSVQAPQGYAPIVDPASGFSFIIIAIIIITTGTMILVWMGEQITEYGIGNGISLLIFAGIIVQVPAGVLQTLDRIKTHSDPILGLILLFLFFVVIALSILLTLGTRKIPVQYGKMISGRRLVQMRSQHIPLRVNATGVMPIIFATSLILFPVQMAQVIGRDYVFFDKIQYYLSPGQIPYMLTYVLLVIFFAYFYTAIQFNPKDLADTIKKNGGFIPGIRPGKNTADFLEWTLNRITLSGGIFLAVIAIVPDIIIRLWPEQVPTTMAYLFGGTSLLIIVGVALDTLKQIESQMMMRHYDGFMKKGRIRGRY